MDYETSRLIRSAVPLLVTLAATLLVLAFAAILSLGREIFVPVALALLLSFVLAPIVRLLRRLGAPQGLAVALTALWAFAALAGLASLVGSQLATLGAELPHYQATIRDKLSALSASAGPQGTIGRAIGGLAGIGQELEQATHTLSSETDRTAPVPVVVQRSGGLLSTVGSVLAPLLHPLATAVLVIVFVVFMLSARGDLRNRFIRLIGPEDIQNTTAAIDDAAGRLGRFFLTQLAINASFGTLIGLGLWAIGTPSPVLWGILAGVSRFVPYVGALVGGVPPLLLAVAVDPGWSMLLWTALLFAILEVAIGQVLEPLLFGHSTGLSPIAIILATAVWTFLWGPVGLILATPLTVCLMVFGRHVWRLGFLDVLLGDRPALSPAEIFYQRMLAGDPNEAVLQARQFLKERALATYYDEIALEALRLAHEDVARGRLTPERQVVLRESTLALVDKLDTVVVDPRPRGGQIGSEAAAAVQAVGPDLQVSIDVLRPADLKPEWRNSSPVVCLARAESLDYVIARIFGQVLRKHGIPASVVTDDDLQPAEGEVRLVCLSYMEPLSTLHLRYAVRAARRRFAGAAVVLGIWRERDRTMGRVLQGKARADAFAPSVVSALATVVDRARLSDTKAVVPAPSRPGRPRARNTPALAGHA